ncbi:SGNH/GDSL hydrolase family protein [Roseovarius sp. B08]|uniref:SGNH/GDSL hydrolase family protein n=1 Tax=Roseovarius sp. B08 TaxID=3449223 RepID=UPI003EDC105E
MRDALRAALLSPVLVPQAAWVMLRAARLPEASGPRDGVAGEGPDLRLLIVGDSSVAGVGVETQAEALAGRLAAHLAPQFRVHWRLEARGGATTATALADLAQMRRAQFDVAVIALGVNDAKNGMRRARWRRNYSDLVALLQDRFGVTRVVASGVPPLGLFPLLPRPLRGVLGRRAAALDGELCDLVARTPALRYVPMAFPTDRGLMAADGFHPAAPLYDLWAGRVAERIREG